MIPDTLPCGAGEVGAAGDEGGRASTVAATEVAILDWSSTGNWLQARALPIAARTLTSRERRATRIARWILPSGRGNSAEV
jgi:hypothetical protein